MSGETRFAFYSATTGSTLPASSIGSGSIETYHLSASAVTPAKADLTQTWNFTGALQVNGVAIGASGSTYLADESSLHLSGSTFSISSSGVTTTHLSNSSVTNAKIVDSTILPAKLSIGATTWDFSAGILRATTPSGPSDVVTNAYFTGSLSASLAALTSSDAPSPMKGSVRLRFPLDDEMLEFFVYDNGAKTLTTAENMGINGGNFAGFTDFAVGQKLLFAVKEDAAAFLASGSWGGIYDITATGSDDPGGSPIVFTRSANFDSDADVLSGSFVFALATNDLPDPQPAFVYLATTGSVTLGTTPLRFPILSGSAAGAVGNAAKGAVRAVLVGDDETVELFAYDGGPKTLTFQGNANLNDFEIGGNTDYQDGDRLLFAIPSEALCFASSGSWSGIYTITNIGQNDPSGSAPVLTRAEDFDTTAEVIPGSFVFALAGDPDTNAPAIWYLASSSSYTLDSAPLLFTTASFGGGGGSYTGSSTIQIDGSAISVKNFSIGPGHLSGTVVYASGGLNLDSMNGLSVSTIGALGIDTSSNSVYIRPNGITAGHLSSSVIYNFGNEPLTLDPGGLRISQNSIGPAYLSSSVAGNGLGGGGGQALSVNVDGMTIQVTNDTLTLATASVGATQLNSTAAGNGLTVGTGLQVLADPIFQNPLVVSVSGTSVREASSTQSGYMSSASYVQLASVVSYSSPPVTAGPIGTAVTTSNTQTAGFNIGVVPANTIWTVKFTTFSIDTAEAANLVNNVGAFSLYRSGSNNVTQVGVTEVEHSFVSGAFSSITMSLNLAQGQPGNADMSLHGINTYNIKHWVKFQITEFVYA